MADEQPETPRAPGRDYFDRWYADMTSSPAKDAILQRHLRIPPALGSAGVLHWDALDEIAAELRLPAGALLLDVACGRGGYGVELARRLDVALVGVDFSAVALGAARNVAARHLPSGRADFRLGTLLASGLPSGLADGLVCTDSVQFAEPPLEALRELRRVLRPGGRLALTAWQATTPGDPRVKARVRHLDLARDLEAAGLVDVVVEPRPAWRAAERAVAEEAVAAPDGDHDAALRSLQEESRETLATFDALQRVVAFATAP